MQTKLQQATEKLIDLAIDEVFYQLHKNFFTKSADIVPEQHMMLEYYKKQLAKICVEIVKQNQ